MSEVTVNISGYRQLSADEQRVINLIKTEANGLLALISGSRDGVFLIGGEPVMLDPERIDQRWVSIAETHLQQGFMALVRAIARPEGF